MNKKVEVGDIAVPKRNYGNCMAFGGHYPIIAVSDEGDMRSFFIDCPCRDIKCKKTGWYAIESDFEIITGIRVTHEEIVKTPSLPSPDAAADFMKRNP